MARCIGPRRGASLAILLLLAQAAACSNDDTGAADAGEAVRCEIGELQALLNDANAGDTVTMNGCAYEGNLSVGAGVILAGADTADSSLTGSGVLIRLEPGTTAAPTTVSGLELSTAGGAAIVAEGSGDIALSELRIAVETGIGIGLDGVNAAISDTSLVGPVTSSNALAISEAMVEQASPWEETATNGLIALRSETNVRNLSVSGFAVSGIMLGEGSHSVEASSVADCLNNGLQLYAATAELSDVLVTDTLGGSAAAENVTAVWADAGSSLQTNGLTITGGAGIGLMETASAGSHETLIVSEQARGGYWIVNAAGATSLSGTDSDIFDNDFTGIAVFASDNVTLSDAHVGGTRLADGTFGEETVPSGDGLHIVASNVGLALTDLLVNENARVGVLIDLDGATWNPAVMDNVVIGAPAGGTELIVQNGVILEGSLDGSFKTDTGNRGTGASPEAGLDDDNVGSTFCTNFPQLCGNNNVGIVTPNNIVAPNNIVTPNNLLGGGLSPLF